jgi:hypothetical protein
MGGIFLGMYFYGDSNQGSNWDIVYTLGEDTSEEEEHIITLATCICVSVPCKK